MSINDGEANVNVITECIIRWSSDCPTNGRANRCRTGAKYRDSGIIYAHYIKLLK